MMQGVSEEEYATVIRVLQRIVGNLQQEGNSKGNKAETPSNDKRIRAA
jgi:hypothetical protein